MDEWKWIDDYEGFYQVSNCGHVRSFRNKRSTKPHLMKEYNDRNGYLVLLLWYNGNHVNHKIHRLVLEAFCGPCPKGMETLHLDNNKQNNHISNLKWGTHQENQATIGIKGEANQASKLTSQMVQDIRRRAKSGETHMSISHDFPVQRRQVTRIINRQRWAHII